MNPLHDAIVAAIPASMQGLVAATGVAGAELWDAVRMLRQAGIIRRRGPHGARMYTAPDSEVPYVPAADAAPVEAVIESKKQRKRPVILFWIPGWPSQDPNRRMLWRIVWNGEPTALFLLKRLKKRFKNDAQWEVASMTPTQARALKSKTITLRDLLERTKTPDAS